MKTQVYSWLFLLASSSNARFDTCTLKAVKHDSIGVTATCKPQKPSGHVLLSPHCKAMRCLERTSTLRILSGKSLKIFVVVHCDCRTTGL